MEKSWKLLEKGKILTSKKMLKSGNFTKNYFASEVVQKLTKFIL